MALPFRRCTGSRGAETKSYNDAQWEVVCAPHTAMLVPSEASGCRNYQGVVWYRKHFTMPADMRNKEITLYFEAIMGRQEIYVNGQKVKENKGGYLPIIVNLTEAGLRQRPESKREQGWLSAHHCQSDGGGC